MMRRLGLFVPRRNGEWQQLVRSGMAMYQAGRYSEAIRLFDSAIEIGGETPELLFQRGMAYSRLGQLSDAIRNFYDVVLARAPVRLQRDAWYNLGKANAELQDLRESIGCYENAIRIDPTYAEAYCNLGGVRLRLAEKEADSEQYEQALQDLDRGLSLDPADSLAYYNRATAKSALQHDDGIFEDLLSFLELAPPDHPYIPDVTKLLQETGPGRLKQNRERYQMYLSRTIIEANNNNRFGEAIENCDKLLEMNGRLGDFWDETAFALMCQGRMEEALACCEEGIARNPGTARLHNTRGLLLLELRRYPEALGAFEKYIAIAPPEYEAVVAKAKIHIQELRGSVN